MVKYNFYILNEENLYHNYNKLPDIKKIAIGGLNLDPVLRVIKN